MAAPGINGYAVKLGKRVMTKATEKYLKSLAQI
jgi:hypothetical protein